MSESDLPAGCRRPRVKHRAVRKPTPLLGPTEPLSLAGPSRGSQPPSATVPLPLPCAPTGRDASNRHTARRGPPGSIALLSLLARTKTKRGGCSTWGGRSRAYVPRDAASPPRLDDGGVCVTRQSDGGVCVSLAAVGSRFDGAVLSCPAWGWCWGGRPAHWMLNIRR